MVLVSVTTSRDTSLFPDVKINKTMTTVLKAMAFATRFDSTKAVISRGVR
jgi:hypothetical protein